MKTRVLFAVICLAVLPTHRGGAGPATLKLPNGQIYHEAEISGWDNAFVTIRHSTGVASIPISSMPAEFRQAIKYDPLKAARQLAAERKATAVKEEQARLLKEQQKIEKRKVYITGVITEMRSGGYATMNASRYGEVEERYKKLEPGKIGDEWKPAQKEISRTVKREIRMEGVEVVGVPHHLQPGATWSGEVWPAGDIPVRNKTGAIISMVTRYATSPALAAGLIEDEKQAAIKAARKQRGY